MGTGRRSWALVWALEALLMVWPAETQGPEELSLGSPEPTRHTHRAHGAYLTSSSTWPVTFPDATIMPGTSSLNPAHNGRVCSTWGDFHYKTFDGEVFRFPGLCNYVFSAHCGAAYEDFNVQLRRGLAGSSSTISRIVLKTQGLVLELSDSSVLVNGQREELPYSRAGFLVEQSGDYVKVSVQLLLTLLWNGRDSALLELDSKYANQTCGLCGDFNGFPASNEFFVHNTRLTPFQFGNLQKLDGPTEQCQDPPPSLASNCTYHVGPRRHPETPEQEAPTNSTEDSSFGCSLERGDICHCTLLGPAFAECHELVDPDAYVAACVQDLCHCPTCPCATIAEYSRQCAQAGGQPQNWRGPKLCPRTCPLNMRHQECGSPCADTCSNPQRAQLCEDHCVAGCFCPPGTVLDDVTHSGCLPLEQCPCTHGGHTYMPGASFTTSCSSCTCSGGLWQCQDQPCPGTCSVQGGSHISTYDRKVYDVHGDCNYILSKKCADSSFTVLAELRKCGLTDTENCLRAVTLSLDGGDTAVRIQASGDVSVNSIHTQLPVSAANLTIFRPTSFFILVQTGLGLQVQLQLVPLMQVYVRLDPTYHGQMCGLCGNFNQNQADDFMALSGVVEGTGAAFSNTWKTQAACPNAKNVFEDPCSLSVENENYARHWCSLLTNRTGPFSACHSTINPSSFYSNCMFDTCNCEKSEDCMCAALSSYVQACAAEGVLLRGWRAGVCTKYMNDCPKSQSYEYVVDTCPPTCHALSEADTTCSVSFVPVDGCTCPENTFLNDAGTCVPAQECPCYLHGSTVANGEVVQEDSIVCSCADGKLSCLGALAQRTTSGCVAPMTYLDCSNVSVGTPGAECLRSCHSLDMDCFSTHCVSGCVCPPGLVADGSGGCIAKEDCPCVHNEVSYKPGATIRVDCNTCTCRNRRWECSSQPCLGTCVAYGDGHFITFDGQRYTFEGSCQYTLAQDYCGGNGSPRGTFRITTENVPCGTTGTTCSKAVRLFLGSYEMVLHEGGFKVVERGQREDLPYKIRYMGLFLVIETRSGLVVSWDRKTSVSIGLRQHYKGRVCGLCGNFDGNALNDFTTRSQAVVGDALEFGNSWKLSPSCPDALVPKDPCTTNPYRKAWAQKQCSVIHSATFATCHSQVDSTKYYEACVHDTCACDSGGDCECFCTAVAAYAQACHEAGVCVSWRTPDLCPLFCDYYNPQGECEWHYQPCGAPCLRTCRNPSAHCLFDTPGLEGCYPKCPPSKPFFNEDQMKCVAQCGCYDEDGNYYDIGTQVPTTQNCQSCHCTPGGLQCSHSPSACTCTYAGQTYGYQDVIYNTTDGLGACLMAVCGDNGTVLRRAEECPGSPTTTPFTFTPFTTGAAPTAPTACVREVCHWSSWYDSSHPEPGVGGGDMETLGNLRQKGYQVCEAPRAIECRAEQFPSTPLHQMGQKVNCDRDRGLTCFNREQNPPLCHNYELRVLCCTSVPCGQSPSPSTSPLNSQSTTTGICQPRCQWTEWFDTNYPTSEEDGGDTETYGRIRATGGYVCEHPKDIQCEAELYPGQSLERVGQKVECDVHYGLRCRNKDQQGLFPMCYNYRIRVHCCSVSHCTGTVSTQPPTRVQEKTTKTSHTISSQSARHTTGIKQPTTMHTTTHCRPKCEWTEWFDTDFPTSGVEGGDMETYENIRAAGGNLCQEPQKIECRAENYPEVSIDQIGQVVTCNTKVGLVCRNRDQTGKFNMCFNYNVRVLCCDYSHCPSMASTPVTTIKPTTLTPTTSMHTTPQITNYCQPTCEWTEWFDTDFPTSGVEGGDMETYENIRAAGANLCQEPQKIECRAENYPEVSIDQIGQVVTCNTKLGLVCRNRDQTGDFNMCFNYNVRVLCCDYSHCPSTASTPVTTIKPTTLTPTKSTHTTPQITNYCQPTCEWTEWFDTDFPTSGVEGGDMETYENIRAAGANLCQEPQKIECRAENYPEVSIDQIGQVVTCNTKLGLVCRNRDQTGDFNMCFNYNVRVLCCDYSHCPSTTIPSSPTSMPTTLAPTTTQPITTKTSTTLAPSTIQTTTSQTTAHCQPKCEWTEWFDTDFPTSGVKGGDMETYENIRAAGGNLCPEPQKIECRAENYPEVSIDQIGQVVTCNTEVGLVCKNRDQKGKFKMCFNYNVRVLCCDYSHCPSTASTPVTTIKPTTLTPTKHTHTTPQTTNYCQPTCEWTEWFDTDFPTSGVEGGDMETYENIRAAGANLCQEPQKIECRAENYPEVSIDQIGQVVTCNTKVGLVCRNRDQTGDFNMCFNYNVRVLCCDYSHCPSTSIPSSPTSMPTTLVPTTTQPITSKTSTTLAPSTIQTTISQTTAYCRPKCEWTEWFDTDFPTSGVEGGDMETYENIRAAGANLCQEPQKIECRAENYPEVSIDQIGQVVTCNTEVGLVCKNRDQKGKFKMCFNYNVRVLCCDYSHCPSTTIPSSPKSMPTTLAPTTTQPITTKTSTTVAPSTIQTTTSQMTTHCQPKCEWTEWFDTDFPTSGVEGGDMETYENIRAAGANLCQEPQKIECRAENYPEVSIDQIGQVVTCNTKVGLVCRNRDQTGKFNMCFNYNVRVLCCDYSHCPSTVSTPFTTIKPTTLTPTKPTHTTPQITNYCQPTCEWTEWFDTDFPTSGVEGGDMETYENIRAAGGNLCQEPQKIECRAENYPEVSIDQIGQVVTCNTKLGLVCRNRDQTGDFNMCFNYNVRVLCCDYSHCPSTASTPVTTIKPTTLTPTKSTHTTPQITNYCQPTCEWTEWFDTDFPTSGVEGGDMETYENIRAAGANLCQEPQKIECRAENYPEVSIDQIGQVVTCNTKVGLVCRNRDQTGDFNMCFNYNVRVLCCDYSHCPSTTIPSSPTSMPTTLAPTTTQPITTKTSTTVAPSTIQTTTSQTTAHCQPKCEWTEWFDTDFPTSGVKGGDMETYENIRAAGGNLCPEPQKIECRAENYPEVSIDQIGQVVTCNTEVGLVCKNRDQKGKFKMCFNYNVRVLCCDYSHCPSTASTPVTTIKPTTLTPTKHTHTTPQITNYCQPTCEWTEWFDTDFPTSGVEGGDMETYENIRAAGANLCQEPQKIECRAENYPEVSIDQIGQVVTCNTKVGLVCRNRDQTGDFNMCFNYNVRVLCCDYSHCPSTSIPSSPTSMPTTLVPTTTQPITSKTSTTLAPSTIQTTISQTTAYCRPKCEWTEWFDTDFPTSGVEGGDMETYENIRAAGANLCQEPQKIECRAENYPEVSIDQIGQVVTCNIEVGLVCKNRDQKGKFKMCFNYNVRVLCCDYNHCPSTTIPSSPKSMPTTLAPTTTQPITTKTSTTVAPSTIQTTTSQMTTHCQPKCEWTEWFDTDFPTSGVEGGDMETYENIRAAGANLCQEPQKIECRAENYPEVSIDQIGQVVTCNTKVGLVCRNRDQTGKFNMCFNYNVRVLCCDYSHCPSTASTPVTTIKPTTLTPTKPTHTTPQSTNYCQPTCEWTEWFDSDFPTSGVEGGDMETYENIRAAGANLCQEPQKIECRAENYPEVSIDQIGQVVTCNTKLGLVCRNRDQTGDFNMCFNYNVRVLCCDYSHCPSTTIPSSPTSMPTTLAPTTTQPITTKTSTTVAPSTIQTTISQTTAYCRPKCEWTEWFDTDFPTSGVEGGDMETYENIRAAGANLCQKPQKIECRAENYPEVSIDQIGQVVTCNTEVGLVCKNRDQKGKFKMCFNYNVRVLCCDYSHCPRTASTPFTTIKPTTLTPTKPTHTTPQITNYCQPTCEWTEWFDTDFPTSGVEGGDMETYENIRAAGANLCQEPQKIECRAENYPEVSIDQIGQVVTCNTKVGLVCRNRDQTGDFNMCFNYNVRVLCCDYSHCPSTSIPSSPTSMPTTLVPTTTQPITSKTSTTLAPSTIQTTISQTTAYCRPKCEWTEWFDTDFPTSGVEGGDMETYENIRAAGANLCQEPQKIECRAENYPEVSIDQIGQVVTCNTEVGLVCKNRDQKGKFKMCFNYNVRVLCCDYSHCPSTTIPSSPKSMPTTLAPTTTQPITTKTSTTVAPSTIQTTTSQMTTHCQPKCEWTEWFDTDFPTSGVEGGDMETYENIRAAGANLCQEPQKIECRAENYPEVSIDQIGQVVTCNTKVGLVCRNRDQTGKFNMCFNYNVRVLCCDYSHCPSTASTPVTTIKPTTLTPTKPTHTTPQTTNYCQPTCEWTEWFDTDFPTSGVEGGDMETYENIRAAGANLCQEPQKIECRAENYPEVSIDQIGQVVTCNTKLGLVCRNRDQTGDFNMCFNYNVRVLCCDYSHCPNTTIPSSPTSMHTTLAPTTTQPITSKTSTTLAPSTIQTTISQTTAYCRPKCEWTEWFDTDFPTSGVEGGDMETYENIRAAGANLCQKPQKIECRAENYPEVSIDQIGQVVTCNTEVGLVCKNRDQKGKFKMCFNYNVRVLCCDYSHCPRTASTPFTTIKPTTLTPTKPTHTTPQITNYCQPTCEWTEWFDTDFPTSGVEGGDMETYENIRAAGGNVCQEPQKIECRAENYPEVSIDQIGQVVTCNTKVGLVCRNRDQTGDFNMCFNYNVRVLCCDYSHCPRTASTPFTTIKPTTLTPTKPTHTTHQTTNYCQPTCEWTEWFDTDFPTSGVEGGDMETYENIRAAGANLCQEPQKIECRAENYPEVSIDQIGQVVTCNTKVGLVCKNRDQTGKFNMCFNYNVRVLCCDYSHCPSTTIPSSPTSMPTTLAPTTTQPITSKTSTTLAPSTIQTTTSQTTAHCQPKCEWTEWFDTDFPTSGAEGGDMETYENIRAAGANLCQEPQKIECRAENYPEVSIDQIGQEVTCNVKVGLVCKNRDQTGKFNMCFNYNVRVLCCDYSHCPITASPLPSSLLPTTLVPTTTQLKTTKTSSTFAFTSTRSTNIQSSSSQPTTIQKNTTQSSTFWPTTTEPNATTIMTTLATTTSQSTTTQSITSWPTPTTQSTTSWPTPTTQSTTSWPTPTTQSTTSWPITTLSTISWPTTTRSTSPWPTTTQSTTSLPITTQSTISWPTTTHSTTFWPSTPQPTTTQNTTSWPTTTQPTTTQSPNSLPTTTQPTTTQRTTSWPTTTQPTTTQSTTSWPNTTQPSTTQSTTSLPTTTQPTTIKSTTSWPNTTQPTTTQRTTSWPTTTQPTTTQGTTSWPTTTQPTTTQSTTSWPTTTQPTTTQSTTSWPTTTQPTTPQSPKSWPTTTHPTTTHSPNSWPTTTQPTTMQRTTSWPTTTQPTTTQSSTSWPTTTQPATIESTTSWPTTTQSTTTLSATFWPTTTLPYTARITTTLVPTTPKHITRKSTTSPLTTTQPTTTTPSSTSWPTTTQTTLPQRTTHCHPTCEWTEWFDTDFPTSGVEGGDMETYENIRAAGGNLCQEPQKIECRAENYPEVSIDQIGQVVTCNTKVGLVCRNRDQKGKFNMCFNYNVRVLCCDYSHCPSTASPLPSTPLPTTLAPTTTQATTPKTTTQCQPTCEWTEWFDTDFPTSGVEGGDMETYENIRAAGANLCQEPQKIECRAENYPEVSIDQIGQVVTCNTKVGLVCRNRDQTGDFNVCFNYNVRVLCCDYSHCPRTASPLPSTPLPTTLVPTTTQCQPKCEWTEWFDTDFPTSGVEGGDMETYKNIRAAGGNLCQEPQKIECRAENYPEVSIDQIGQVVTCNLQVGLVCRNQDQTGDFNMCFNYNVRVLCCDYSHCPVTAALKSSTTSSTPGPTSSLVPPHLSSSPTPSSLCLCKAFGRLFSPGEVIYNKTDGAGCNFYAICTPECGIERFQGVCPTSSSPTSSTPVPPRSPPVGCDNAVPPRQVNESWTLENCTVARCEGSNRVVLLEPAPVASITCVSQHMPTKVRDQSQPCLFHYECECFCSGWGHRNLVTFDGTSYSFLGDCTYTLMKEIHPRHGNLSILVDHHHCRAHTTASCPPALRVHYESTEVVLTTSSSSGGTGEESLILFNQMRVSRGFSKNGISVSVTGATVMGVHIPAIGVSITFNGHIFQIQLPFGYFGHNTEGQCGTCTNSQSDDCRRPDGTIAPTCQDMATSWVVPDSGRADCSLPVSTSPPPPVHSTPSPTPCPPAPLCKLMLSQVFAECHRLIPPGPFFHTCVSDSCQADTAMLCQNLEAYAALCRSRNTCVDWRNATSGLCDLPCPPTKVYRPCGPMQPASCDSRTQSALSSQLAEGCFCPEDQLLFSLSTDICVPECSTCVGPDGSPKFLGEQWLSNCQSCVCDEGSASVRCKPVQCEAQALPLQCGQPGFVALTRPQADNPCCSETLCVCNVTTCPQDPPECGPEQELTYIQEKGSCCPNFSCRPKLCDYNGTVHGVGATFPGVVPCHTCTCVSMGAQAPTVQCKEVACTTSCPQGFEYSSAAGQCVPISCFTPDGQSVKPNETWVSSHLDNCTEYRCEAKSGVPVLTPQPKPCPDVSNCTGTLRKAGCCYSCEERDLCQVHSTLTILRYQDCETETAVSVSFCEGSCPGVSKYSMEAQAMQHQCTCCQERKTHQEAVTMRCPNGIDIQHTYTQVDECSCSLSCLSSFPPIQAPMDTYP